MNDSPIKYTSTDYASVMNDIDSDLLLKDRPRWWKRIWAGVRDVIGVQINAAANQSGLRTSFTRQKVADHLALIDYQIRSFSTSSGLVIFNLDPAFMTFPHMFAASDLIAQSQASLVKGSKQFEARDGITVSAVSEAFTRSGNKLTIARVYTTGEKVRVSSSVTLPAPLQPDTDYYAIYDTATTIYLADSVLHAFNGTYIVLTDAGTGTHTIVLWSFQKLCYQQESLTSPALIGTSDSAVAWQMFFLPDKYVLDETLSIEINSVVWDPVTTFVDSLSTDKVYKILNLDKGMKAVIFGDGTYGEIPGNFGIYASYATGGTSLSNVYSKNSVNAYAGGNTRISSCTNDGEFTGGADEETIVSAKVSGPILLKARSRDITINDSKYLAQAYPGVMKVGVNPNYYGLLSQQIVVVPSGGGTPSPTLLAAIKALLDPLCILDSIYNEAVAPTYVPVVVVATVHKVNGWTWALVQSYVILALRLMFSEITTDIYNTYKTYGIADAVTAINTKWSTSFVSTDYNSIVKMLDNVTPADFGMSWEQSDVEGFIDSFVDGVDYIIIASPSFPITTAVYEISQDNISPSDITEIA